MLHFPGCLNTDLPILKFYSNPDLHMDVSLSHFNLFLANITELPADHLECIAKRASYSSTHLPVPRFST